MLEDISPLENLSSLGLNLHVLNNALLPSLIGLENIDAGSIIDINIYDNPMLSECDVQSICDYLVSPNGTVNIHDNATGCSSQQEVEDVCSDNCLPEGIEFLTQWDIDNFQSNYPDCNEILGNVTIGEQWYSSNISNLDGLSILTGIGGYLDVRLNDYLISLNGLSNLSTVGGLISIFNNDGLTDLSGLEQITTVNENLYITYNDALTSLTGLENLTFVGGDLTFRENTVLPNLDGLENLNSVGGALEIRINAMLESMCGLNGINSIGDYLWIVNNPVLPSLEGLEGISSIPGYLDINYNPDLLDLTGLDNLSSISGYLYIRDNDNMINLTGLDNLNSIGEHMEFRNNDALENLTALQSLTSIGAEFRVWDNDILTSLSGLDNVEANSISDLYINDNALLSVCDIESVCNYLIAPNGAIYIHNNASGCADQEEVEDACFNDISEFGTLDYFSITPNPVSTLAQIRFIVNERGNVICDLYEVSGVCVKHCFSVQKTPGEHNLEIDMGDLPKGVYICVLKTTGGVFTEKVVKL